MRNNSAAARPLIAQLLCDEGWYGDGEPHWQNAPSSVSAKQTRRHHVKRLRRFASSCPGADGLADLLNDCEKDRRCKRGACPECTRAFGRWLVANIRHLIDALDPQKRRELVAVSVVPYAGAATKGKLDQLDLVNLARRLKQACNVAAVHWMAGGFDISLNDDAEKGLDEGWQAQLYSCAAVMDRAAFSTQLRKRFTPSKRVQRPVFVKDSDGSNYAVSYGFKTDFVRRVGYRGNVGRAGHQRRCWKTRKVALRPLEHVGVLLWLDTMGLAGRLFLQGVRMTRTARGVQLVKLKNRI
jgi:hypothetical protein